MHAIHHLRPGALLGVLICFLCLNSGGAKGALASTESEGVASTRFEIEETASPSLRPIIWAIDERVTPPVREAVGEVVSVPIGTRLYHWGPDALRQWAAHGFPDDEGMQSRRSLSGYYVSSNITGAGYGPVLIAYEVKREIRVGHYRYEKLSAFVDHGLPFGQALMQFEDRLGLDGHDDNFDGEDRSLAVNHPDTIIQPHLGTIDDLYRSEEFLAGKFTIHDFFLIEGGIPFEQRPTLLEHYPMVYKLLSGGSISDTDEKSIVDQAESLAESLGWILNNERQTGAIARAIRARFGQNIIDACVRAIPSPTSVLSPELAKGLAYFKSQDRDDKPASLTHVSGGRSLIDAGCASLLPVFFRPQAK